MSTEHRLKTPSAEELEANRIKIKSHLEKEQKLRRQVYESILVLSETVNDEILQAQLQSLDSSSWEEVIEERYLGKVCGWPICENPITLKKMQKYHIDRKQKKVFEVCTDRAKFCSSKCFDHSAAVRSQLSTEALWITGIRKHVVFNFDVNNIAANPKSELRSYGEIDLIADNVVANLSTLRIADHALSSEDEHEKEDEEFTKSIKTFVGDKTDLRTYRDAVALKSKHLLKDNTHKNVDSFLEVDSIIHEAELKNATHASTSSKFSSSEEQKLAKLRAKYGMANCRSKQANKNPSKIKTAPILIDAPVMVAGKEDGVANVKIESILTPLKKDEMDAVEKIIRNWVGDRTIDLVRSGGARPVSDVDRLLRRFYAGDNAENDQLDDSVRLPNVGIFDAHKMRSEIVLTALRRPWQQMTRRLGTSQNHSLDLPIIVRSLNLNSENVAGHTPAQLHVVVLVLWRIVCMLYLDQDDIYFPSGVPSKEITDHLHNLGVNSERYSSLIRELEIKLNFDAIKESFMAPIKNDTN